MFKDVKEAATYLKCSRRHLDYLRKEGAGPICSKVGGKWLYTQKDLNKYVADQRPDSV